MSNLKQHTQRTRARASAEDACSRRDPKTQRRAANITTVHQSDASYPSQSPRLRSNFSHSPLPLTGPCSTSSGHPSCSCSSPGLTSRLSSVAIARASSHEYPVGRQSMYTTFFRQLPWENGFGGAGPSGTSVLCAWSRIYTNARAFARRDRKNARRSATVPSKVDETAPGPRHARRH